MSVTEEEWKNVRLLACDVDGVLTDGTVLYGRDGELAKSFFIRDGMGLRLLEAADVRVAVITSEDSPVVGGRVKRLMLSAYKPGMKRKGDALRAVMQQFGVTEEQTAYVGDDVNDSEAFEAAGIPCAPADATEFARESARYVTAKPGGRGAVREIADLIIAAKGLNPDELWRGIHKAAESHDAGSV
ncbi:MAG: HAD hydrolase family protein [Planctomycetes bacterium]|nr:HAD hydrolase family protein [Planctomycetota bacterium]